MEEPKIKGSCWIETLKATEIVSGPEGIEKIKAALGKNDFNELFEKTIISTSWLNYNSFVRFYLVGDKLLGSGFGEWIEAVDRQAAHSHFHGLYRMIFKYVISPSIVMKGIPLAWKQQIDQGKVAVSEKSKNHLQITVTDFNPCLHHEIVQIPYWKAVLELCGGKNLIINHPQCIARKDKCCRYDVQWE